MNKDTIIRDIKEEEIYLLEEFLYEAIFQSKGSKPLPRDIIKNPELWVYIDGIGNKKDDFCIVAEIDSKIVGAVWTRILSEPIRGYGYIDSHTPEFAISILPEYRKLGIGTLLMSRMQERLTNKGYQQASLSVDKVNYAIKMYLKLGFKIIKENEQDYLMLLKLRTN